MNRFFPAVLLIFLAGCTCHVPIPSEVNFVPLHDSIALYHHPLELRFSKPKSSSNRDILIVYATGDGGWRGLDEKLFEWISGWNYPVVGFSSKSYLKNLEYIRDTTTPRRLVRDFETIIGFAEQELELPKSTRVILVGLSRGAGLDVVAAGQGGLQANLAGVVAVALTKEEEHVTYHRHHRRSQPDQPKREKLIIQTYEYLLRISSAPIAVIQSTHDGYLPASAARTLFGPDTELKRLIAIPAKNHRFTGGRLDLYKEAKTALAWICNIHSMTPVNKVQSSFLSNSNLNMTQKP